MAQHLFVTFVEETANFSEGCRAPKSSQEETLRGWLCACVVQVEVCAWCASLCAPWRYLTGHIDRSEINFKNFLGVRRNQRILWGYCASGVIVDKLLHHFLAWFLHSPRSVFGCALVALWWRLGAYWWKGYGWRCRMLRCACAYSAAYASRAMRCALRCACALLSRAARLVARVSMMRAMM